ncbi:MAG: hypothetical protein JWM11_3131 [Planctomycetaceae bacterium]|nr:hypothetical protein [Planctomycetaceae bacterium]
MASVLKSLDEAEAEQPPLRDGDRMSQPEFHRRYEMIPAGIRFELIQGVVSMNAAAMKLPHNDYVSQLVTQAMLYSRRTPGVHAGAGATVILNEQNEPEPDVFLRLQPGLGGSSSNTEPHGGYVQGPPEQIIEIADSTVFRDLHQKKDVYQQVGVKEYIVVCVENCEIKWFTWPEGEREIPPDKVLRSLLFPGFWLDVEALFRLDGLRLEEVLFRGLASPEYVAFREELQGRKLRLEARS